jgi:uroporphyrinogen-III synthase
MSSVTFGGLRVLSLESRRAREIAKLVANYGGLPVVAPALREIPLESNTEAIAFADALLGGEFDLVILLTGVGTRALVGVVESVGKREAFLEALRRVPVVVRGPKPLAVLRELNVPAAIVVPEPNTWRELLRALDDAAVEKRIAIRGARVAVQEYGVSNPELLSGLAERGAIVVRVPVYQWALPENLAPLENAIRAISEGRLDVILFTTGIQVTHLVQVAKEMKFEIALRHSLEQMVIASIGPSTTESLRHHGLAPDLEPEHPKMGFLVELAAARSAELLMQKRGPSRN